MYWGSCLVFLVWQCDFYYTVFFNVLVFPVTGGRHELVPKNVFTEAEKYAKVCYCFFNSRIVKSCARLVKQSA